MESFLEIPESIKAYLVADEGLRNVKFVSSSLKEKVPNPIIKTYVTIGINQIEISPGAFSGYMGLNDDAEVYGDLADISVGMKIYCPKTEDGGNCYKVFSKIYNIFSIVFHLSVKNKIILQTNIHATAFSLRRK